MGGCSQRTGFHVLSKMNPENGSRGAPSQCCHYSGDYGFMVEPGETEVNENDEVVIAKNVNFTFSPHLKTLFVKRKEKCPFTISVSAPAPAGSTVKIILFAKLAKPQKDKASKSKSVTRHPVMRCRHHSESEQDAGLISPLHVVRSENTDAVYNCCEETGELSISFPFRGEANASAKNQMDIENLCFLCYSSCIREDNKDGIFLKFSLEHKGVVIGSHVFGLHVCSTPGRDRYNHERGTNFSKKSRKREAPTATEDTRVFEIKTRRRWIYDYLRKLNRGLELEEAIPLHVQERYLKSFHKNYDQQASTSQSSSSTSTSNSTNAPNDVRLSLRRVLVR